MAIADKERIKVVELKQPRCALSYSLGDRVPATAANLTASGGSSLSAASFTRDASAYISVTAALPASPNGVLFEIGGINTAAYLGFTNSQLVFRVGDATVIDYGNDCAMLRRGISAIAGKTVQIVAEVIMPDKICLGVYESTTSKCLIYAETKSPNGQLRDGLWGGSSDGGVGYVNIDTTPNESAANFNGTISNFRYWDGEFSPAGCQAAYTVPCYNVWGTCQDRTNYDASHSITWRFTSADQEYALDADYSDPDNPKTSHLPCLQSASARSSKINVGAIRDGQKPLGVSGEASASFIDMQFDDYIGDPYLSTRTISAGASFWSLFAARVPFFRNITMTIREGLRSQSYDEFTSRSYILDSMDGPDNNGNVSLSAIDPLRTLIATESKFPRETFMELSGAIDSTTTTIVVAASKVEDLTDAFGIYDYKILAVGSELIHYTGISGSDGLYTLSGVVRGAYGSEAAAHDDGLAVQRCGVYDNREAWEIAADLIQQHSKVNPAFVDAAAWEAEYSEYLAGAVYNQIVVKPTGVYDLLGELVRDSSLYIWWDETAAQIRLKAISPSYAETSLSFEEDIIEGSAKLTRAPAEQFSQVVLFHSPIDPTKGTSDSNMKYKLQLINGDVENEDSGGTTKVKEIRSSWIKDGSIALQVVNRLIARFQYAPRYFQFSTLREDLKLGMIVDLSMPQILNTDRSREVKRWQLISEDRNETGEVRTYLAQEFAYQAARYGRWMADDAPPYDEASEDEKNTGMWWCDATEQMPDGTEGYKWQ